MTKRIEELELQIGQDDEALNWGTNKIANNFQDKNILYIILI